MTSVALKTLTAENWLSADPDWKAGLAAADIQNEQRHWIASLNDHQLQQWVPPGPREVHTVARGVLTYSSLYRPLLILGIEQSVRVAEGAASLKCKTLDAPRGIRSLADKIEWLADEGVIAQSQQPRWHELRQLRNFGSPVNPSHLLNPDVGLAVFGAVTNLVNALFA